MINRRNLLKLAGIGTAVVASGGVKILYEQLGTQLTQPVAAREWLAIRVYGHWRLTDPEEILGETNVPTVRIKDVASGALRWTAPADLKFIFNGPLTVTRIAAQVPRSVQSIQQAFGLQITEEYTFPNVMTPVRVGRGETLTVLFDDHLLRVR